MSAKPFIPTHSCSNIVEFQDDVVARCRRERRRARSSPSERAQVLIDDRPQGKNSLEFKLGAAPVPGASAQGVRSVAVPRLRPASRFHSFCADLRAIS